MWELHHKESSALKNWCFWTVVLEKTRESPLVSERDQSILKEINPEYSLKWLILKLQYFCHLMQKAVPSKRPQCCEKLRAGGEEGGRPWDGWMTSPTWWTWVWANKWWWRTGKPRGHGVTVRHDWATKQHCTCLFLDSHCHAGFKKYIFICQFLGIKFTFLNIYMVNLRFCIKCHLRIQLFLFISALFLKEPTNP